MIDGNESNTKKRLCSSIGLPETASDEQIKRRMEQYRELDKKNYPDGSNTLKLIEKVYQSYINSLAEQEMNEIDIKEDEPAVDDQEPIAFDDTFIKMTNKKHDDLKKQEMEESKPSKKYKIHKQDKPRQAKKLHLNKDKFIKIVIGGVVVLIAITAGYNINEAFKNAIEEGRKNITNDETITYVDQDIEEYSFDYEVMPGDTLSGIKERFSATKVVGADGDRIYDGQVLKVYTNIEEIAKGGQKLYDAIQEEKEPTSFEEYVVQPGDKLPEIADKFGVTCDDIMRYNPQIKDIATIYAGDTYQIPQWEKTNVKK